MWKSNNAGYHMRDPMRNPVTDRDCAQLHFLRDFGKWIEKWEEKPKSKETCFSKTDSLLCKTNLFFY